MAAPFSTHAVSSIVISPDASRIATACGDDSATVLVSSLPQGGSGERYSSLGPSSDSSALETGACVTSLAWDGDSRLYATDTRGALTLYSAASTSIPGLSRVNEIVAAHSGHSLTGVAASPNLVVTTAKDGLVKAWDPQRSTCIARLKGHKGETRAVALGALDGGDMHLLASAGRDKTVRVWDVRVNNANSSSNVAVLEGHQGWVHDVALCAGPRPRIVSCAGDKTVRSWDLAAMKMDSVWSGHQFRVWTVAADPLGKFAISGSTDTTVRFWDLDDDSAQQNQDDAPKENTVWEAHGDSVLSVAVARDASFAVSASENGSVVKWDIARMIRGDIDQYINDAQLSDTYRSNNVKYEKNSPQAQKRQQQQAKRKPESPITTNPPLYADSAPLLDAFPHPSSPFINKQVVPANSFAATPPPAVQKTQPSELLAPVSLHSSSNVNINSPRRHLRVHTTSSPSSREARSSPGSGSDKTRESTPEKKKTAPASRRARNLSDDLRESRASPTKASLSPLSPARKLEEEENNTTNLMRIRNLEDEVVKRETELADRDNRLRHLEAMMMRREREMEALRKQLESAENLAKQANVRALAAEHKANSTSSVSTSIDGTASNNNNNNITHADLDYSESIDRIERVTGKLRALASKLDGM